MRSASRPLFLGVPSPWYQVRELEVTRATRRLSIAMSLVGAGWCVAFGALADGPTRLEAAIEALDGDHDVALSAVRALRGGGAPAAQGIRDAWRFLSPLAQRRALRALASLAREQGVAVEVLSEAAQSSDDKISNDALWALAGAGPRGLPALAALVDQPPAGDRAALTLARADPGFGSTRLLEAMAVEGGASRPALREALAVAAVREPAKTERSVKAWLDTGPPASAAASAAVALQAAESQRASVTILIEYAIREDHGFDTEWRLLEALPGAGPSDAIDAWARSRVQEPDAWMLRAAAIDAVAERGYLDDVRMALEDPYPRVRAVAVHALAEDESTITRRATLARRDSWPLVRAEAVASLEGDLVAMPVVVAAVDDPMSEVRTAAIAVLVAAPDGTGWDRVHARLRKRNEWPAVTAAAIEYVVAHCRTDAVEALFVVIRRAASPSPRTDDLNNAARAIEALRVLGSPESEAALEHLRGTEGVPPTLKMALEEPVADLRRCPAPSP